MGGVLIIIAATAGCSPSLAPLYRDFDAAGAEPEPTSANESIDARIRRAVAQAGWEFVESAAPNVIATKARIVRRFGLYYTEVSIEVSPVNQTYVRVLVHPYRVYFTGHRSKMPFMKRSIRNAVFPDLGAAFEAEGIRDVGYAQKRDGVSDG
jgi:hypothetical protein